MRAQQMVIRRRRSRIKNKVNANVRLGIVMTLNFEQSTEQMRCSRPASRSFIIHVIFTLVILQLAFAPSAVLAEGGKRGHGAAAFAAVESYMHDGQQQPLLASAYAFVSSHGSSTSGTDGEGGEEVDASLNRMNNASPLATADASANQTATKKGRMSAKALQQPRWGHTSAYLPQANVMLFTGGQIGTGKDGEAVTNDVFALDMVNATNQDSNHANNRWIRLSSTHLAPHAFAARAVTHSGNHKGEHLFLIGGATADCSISNAPVHIWTVGKHGAWQKGRWTTPTIAENQTLPPRRKGAMAVQVPVAIGLNETEAAKANERGGVAVMVLGGYADYTTCNASAEAATQQPAGYSHVDIWTMGQDATQSSSGSKSKRDTIDVQKDILTVRTLPLDPRMPNMSMVDYSLVLLPENKTAELNARVLFVGGRDAYGAFTPMNQLWSLDVQTSKWERLQTTNGTGSGLDIPLGRMGHSSTLLDDGRIVVHGGYVTLDNDQLASNDTFVLDPRVNPAVWHKVTPDQSQDGAGAPRRAYHTAVIAHGVLVLGFGQQGSGAMASTSSDLSGLATGTGGRSAVQKADNVNTSGQQGSVVHAPVHYLDTKGTNAWSWTTDFSTLMAMRNQDASGDDSKDTSSNTAATGSTGKGENTENAGAASASQEGASPSAKSAASAATGQSKSATANHQASKQASNDPSVDPNNSDTAGEEAGTSSKQRNTAVIASVLGATALAASLGGLYFARKRRMSRSDASSVGDDDKYERFDDSQTQHAPPVSSLWINQPIAWANNAGKGLRRHASMASEAFVARTRSMRPGGRREGVAAGEQMQQGWRAASSPAVNYSNKRPHDDDEEDEMRYSGAAEVFQVMRKLPPSSRMSVRRSEMQRQRDVRARLSAHEARYVEYDDEDHIVDTMLGGRGRMAPGTVPVPDDFIQTLLDEDDFVSDRNAMQNVNRGVYEEDGLALKSKKSVSLKRHQSGESLASSSIDGASHFSYPYLAAMHRPSMGDLSQNLSPTSSKQVGLNGQHESPTTDGENEQRVGKTNLVVSPREALLRASLSRSPGSQPLYNVARSALNFASPALSSPAFDLLLGKNARLSERISNASPAASAASPSPPVHFDNPFADVHALHTPLAEEENNDGHRDYDAVSDVDETTELDLRTTIVNGHGRNSPAMNSALFPWEGNGADSTQRQGFPYPSSPSPLRHSNRDMPRSTQRLPMYKQPMTGGVRLPIHPALISAAAAHSTAVKSNRRARPSLLRVTNHTDGQPEI